MHVRRLFNLYLALMFYVLTGTIDLDGQVPFSDPDNTGNWVLNTDVSDEFEGDVVDEDRWYIVGKFEDGVPVYKDPDNPNRNVWIGRAPSQFSGRNYRLDDGKLKMETRWEPDFPFSDTFDEYGDKRYYFENVTTPCFIGRRMFHYGYMEIKSKAADAEITSAFWSTGNNAEFDFFEMFGDHRQENKLWKDRELWWSIHDWRPGMGGASVYTEHHDLGFRVADGFHIYGIEWDETGVKYYVDGTLFTQATREEIDAYAKDKGFDEGYVITKPLKLWLDMETFPWHGVPDSKEDLTLNGTVDEKAHGRMDYQIEYVRVWQKEDPNQLDGNFFGFENKIEIDGSEEDWWIPATAKEYMTIGTEKPANGDRSLKFGQSGTLVDNAVAFAPFGSTVLDPGDYTFSMNVWLKEASAINNLRIVFEDPWTEMHFDLTGVETGKWVTLSKDFSRNVVSGPKDRPRILVKPLDTSDGVSLLYIDDLKVVKSTANKVGSTQFSPLNIYPNPTSDRLIVNSPNVNSVTIYNIYGHEVKQLERSTNPYHISVAEFPSGFYTIVAETLGGRISEKFQIIR